MNWLGRGRYRSRSASDGKPHARAMLPPGETHLFVGFPFRPGDITAFELPLEISNTGERSLQDASVLLRFHSMTQLRLPKDFGQLVSNTSGATRLESEIEPFDFVTYNIKRVDPGVGVRIDEPLMLRETRINDEGTFTTADGHPIHLKYAFDYSLEMGVTAMALDTRGWNGVLWLSGVQARDIDELTDKVIKSIERECVAPPQRGLLSRLFGPAPPTKTRELLVVFPTGKLLTQFSGGRVFAATVPRSGAVRVLRVIEPIAALIDDGQKGEEIQVRNLRCAG